MELSDDPHVHGRRCVEHGCEQLEQPVAAQPPPAPRRHLRYAAAGAAGAAVILLGAGAFSAVQDEDTAASTGVVAAQSRNAADAAAEDPPDRTDAAPEAAGPDAGLDAAAEALKAPREVPSVVGLTLLDAQKQLLVEQFIPTGVDGTGAGRIPLLSSNWLVVSQEPAAGTLLPPGRRVVLTVTRR